jgi:AraC-like DNA-binding protein
VLLRVFLEGAFAQLFALQADALGASTSGRPVEGTRTAIEEARRILVADMAAPPSLAGLARSVGLTEKALSAGFRDAFGATVFETLRNERLEHARLALADQQLPLKLIAARVGYSHVNNFIAAFTARYGAPPRRYVTRSDKD